MYFRYVTKVIRAKMFIKGPFLLKLFSVARLRDWIDKKYYCNVQFCW